MAANFDKSFNNHRMPRTSKKKTVVRRSFALTIQKRKGTIVILDFFARLRKIKARVHSFTDQEVVLDWPVANSREKVNFDHTHQLCSSDDDDDDESRVNKAAENEEVESDAESDVTERNPDVPPLEDIPDQQQRQQQKPRQQRTVQNASVSSQVQRRQTRASRQQPLGPRRSPRREQPLGPRKSRRIRYNKQ